MKYTYPALFEYDKNEKIPYSITFPDIFGGVTCGKDEQDAIYMAKDLLKLMLTTSPDQCDKPSTIEELKIDFPDKEIVMVEVDI